MQYYKLKWKLNSPLETMLQADTIFGHICWAVCYIYGEDELENFLALYDQSPPLLISDGFQENKLPVPKLPPTLKYNDDFKKCAQNKRLKKIKFIQADTLNRISSELTSESIRSSLRGSLKNNEKQETKTTIVSHNTIDRLTATARQTGGFYQQEVSFYPNGTVFDVYMLIDETKFSLDMTKIFEYIEKSGYGKNKSTGRGTFKISYEKFDGFGHKSDHNSYMALSSFCPAKNDSAIGFYDLKSKLGRLGGSYAVTHMPFKNFITSITTGSVFFSKTSVPPLYCGRIINDAHPVNNKIKHYGYALTYPLNIQQEVNCV